MTHYDTLEVSPNASAQVIRAAYKSLMQRYHPDKNLANAATPERAAELARAYGVLSDPDQRSAYDLHIQTQTPLVFTAQPPTSLARSAVLRQQHAPKAGDKSPWLLWLLILVVVVCSGLLLSLSGRNAATPVPTPTAPQPDGQKNPSSQNRQTTPDDTLSGAAKSASLLLATQLTVRLAGVQPYADRTLSIPAVYLQIGPTNSAQVSQYIEQQQVAITAQLTDELALASYQELIKVDGDIYLKNLILAATQRITGTQTLSGASAPLGDLRGSYGVSGVVLPDSFSLK